jgi:hypothetical protein
LDLIMNVDDNHRIERDHGPSIVWQNGAVGWQCVCGGRWPCPVFQLADDARQRRARVARDAGQAVL